MLPHQNSVCLRTLLHASETNPWSLQHYRSLGGYRVYQEIIASATEPPKLLEQIKIAALRGRGGAGFATANKLGFIKREQAGIKYLICNADEGEPGTFKDRDILLYNPHQLLEGMAIASYITGASTAYIYLRGEFLTIAARLDQAINEAEQAGYLTGCRIYTFLGAGAYICGEETALLESLEGKRGLPRFKPPFPAVYGLYGCPTTVHNVETLATLPVILAQGGTWHLQLGKPNNGGCKIFSVSGHVTKPGNYELPLGTPFRELLAVAGGVWHGKQLKAVIPGGSSAPVLPAAIIDSLNMDYDSLAAAGSMLGAGSVIIMDEDTCMVSVLRRLTRFYYEESCGQCTPCREGTGWLWRLVSRILAGEGRRQDLVQLAAVANNMMGGRTICAFGDAAAMPVLSFIKHFAAEFERLVRD
jgi:NADH-quinone oxidoreductase subunit F